jgi:methyl-accepting chemotaxis protein
MTVLDFFNEFYKENSQFDNIKLDGDKLIITEDTKRPFGNRIIFDSKTFLLISDWGGKKERFNIREFTDVEIGDPLSIWSFSGPSMMRKGHYILNNIKIGSYGGNLKEIEKYIKSFQKKLKIHKQNGILFGDDLEKIQEDKRLKELRIEEETRLKKLQVSQTNVLNELDKDGNGEIDVVEGNDFNLLLKKHQKSIVEIDRNYVQQFVKISSYLKTKKDNIQSIFNSIKDTPNQKVLNEYVEILKDEIHSYNLILLNSLNMIVSLVEDDMITFYEIHEKFDNLNMFDSKHEKDISQKLENIGDGLKTLMYEIREVGEQISYSIQDLTYATEELNNQLTNQLSEIDSTLKVGNLINTINTYQNYKNNRRLN